MSSTLPLVRLPGTQLSVSRFIFGTASLFNVGNAEKRLALLEAAVAAGFTHFDTAPYYGFGWAERDLGELSCRHRHVSVTTKVGIYSPGGEHASRAAVFVRKAVGRVIPAMSKPTIDFSLARAQKSLTASLQRLRCDHIALYMLHEPELQLLSSDEWCRWLEAEVARGRVASFGLALTSDRLTPFLNAASELAPVIQVLDSLDGREADCVTTRGRPLQITYGYVSAARKAGSSESVGRILGAALLRNQHGAIIVSTTKLQRLAQYASIAQGRG